MRNFERYVQTLSGPKTSTSSASKSKHNFSQEVVFRFRLICAPNLIRGGSN